MACVQLGRHYFSPPLLSSPSSLPMWILLSVLVLQANADYIRFDWDKVAPELVDTTMRAFFGCTKECKSTETCSGIIFNIDSVTCALKHEDLKKDDFCRVDNLLHTRESSTALTSTSPGINNTTFVSVTPESEAKSEESQTTESASTPSESTNNLQPTSSSSEPSIKSSPEDAVFSTTPNLPSNSESTWSSSTSDSSMNTFESTSVITSSTVLNHTTRTTFTSSSTVGKASTEPMISSTTNSPLEEADVTVTTVPESTRATNGGISTTSIDVTSSSHETTAIESTTTIASSTSSAESAHTTSTTRTSGASATPDSETTSTTRTISTTPEMGKPTITTAAKSIPDRSISLSPKTPEIKFANTPSTPTSTDPYAALLGATNGPLKCSKLSESEKYCKCPESLDLKISLENGTYFVAERIQLSWNSQQWILRGESGGNITFPVTDKVKLIKCKSGSFFWSDNDKLKSFIIKNGDIVEWKVQCLRGFASSDAQDDRGRTVTKDNFKSLRVDYFRNPPGWYTDDGGPYTIGYIFCN